MKLAFYLEKCDSPTGKIGDFRGLSMLVINSLKNILQTSLHAFKLMHFSLTKHVVN